MLGTFTRIWTAAAATLLAASAQAQFQPAAPLPRAIMSHTAVVLDGRVYAAGGVGDDSSANYLNNVFYCARILADGQLGPWQEASPMPEFLGLGLHASVAHNGRLYVLGGSNLYGPRNVSYHSGVNPDGTLTGWAVTTPLPVKMYAHAAAVYGGRIYITGGIARIYGPRQLTYSAPVNADGSLGAWRQETSLPSTLFGHGSFARGGRLFVLGGSSSAGLYGPAGAPEVSAAVYSAAINSDGTLGAWEAQPPLPSGLAFFGLAVSEKSAYLAGGFNGGVSNAVYFAPFSEAGALGSWTALHALPKNLLSLASVSNGDFLYSIGGGLSYLGSPVQDIYFARLKADLQAFVKMTPTAINAKSGGKWVTVIIGLPEADAGTVDPGSVRISAVNGSAVAAIAPDPKWAAKAQTGDSAEFSGLAGVRYMTLKFSRQDVAAVVKDGEFTIELEGRLTDGRGFRGRSMNKGLNSSRLVSSDTAHLQLYQALAGEQAAAGDAQPARVSALAKQSAAAAPEISLGEVYVFPNPARPGETPKLHIAASSGGKASVKVFSASGRLAYETEVSGPPGLVDGSPAYELSLSGEFPSGVYYYSAEVTGGAGKLRKAGKFAVIR